MNANSAHVGQVEQAQPLQPVRARADSSAIRLLIYLAQIGLDLSAIAVGFGLANAWRNHLVRAEDLRVALLALPLFLLVGFSLRAYSVRAFQSHATAASRSLGALATAVALILFIQFGAKQTVVLSRTAFLAGFLLASALLLLARFPLVWLVKNRLSRDFVRRMLILDDAAIAAPDSFDTVEAADQGITPNLDDPISLHNFSWLVAGYDSVVIACPIERREAWSLYLQAVGCAGDLLIPELAGIAPTKRGVGDVPAIAVSTGPLDLRDRVLKRVLDLAVTVPLILALSPVLLAVALAVKLDSPGPVLFRQQRIGRGNRLFHVLKFRSMRAERADHSGERSASRDDDRITRVGRIIRATSLDELPQLFNILQGDMALVGPRPHALGSRAGDALFWHVDQRYWLRHSIKPGLTGLAQVRGFRGATDHRDDLKNRLHSDLEYLQNWSLFRDIAILFRTGAVVVHRKAY
jgi:polysaccharide biosynthesis protein PslA